MWWVRHVPLVGDELHIAQPVLSRQIRALEKDLGTPLLTRDSHGVALTDAGRQLLTDAGPLLASTHAVRRRVSAAARDSRRLMVDFRAGIAVIALRCPVAWYRAGETATSQPVVLAILTIDGGQRTFDRNVGTALRSPAALARAWPAGRIVRTLDSCPCPCGSVKNCRRTSIPDGHLYLYGPEEPNAWFEAGTSGFGR